MPLSGLERTALFEQSGMMVLNQHLKITRNLACESGMYRAVMTLGNQFTRRIRLYRGDERLPLVTMEERPRTRGMTMTAAMEAAGVPPVDATYLTGVMKAINERPLRFPVPHTVMIRSGDSITVIDPACTIRRAAAIRAMVRRTGLPIGMVLNSHYHPDHWGNNGRIDSGECPILLHPMARAYLDTNYYRFMYRYCAGLFRDFDLADVYRRLLGMPRGAAKALDRVHGRAPAVMNSLLMLYNLKFTGLLRQNRKRISYLEEADRARFLFGDAAFTGWDLGSGLIALETPGHSPDHLSFYHRESGFLYIADIDIFLNPNIYHDGSIAALQGTIERLAVLARHERITLLLGAHTTPIAGTGAIVAYLRDFSRKLAEVRRVITAIISPRNDWHWPALMAAIGSHEHPSLREAMALNWPRSLSNIDMYVHILLKELGYETVGTRGRAWQKVRDGALQQQARGYRSEKIPNCAVF